MEQKHLTIAEKELLEPGDVSPQQLTNTLNNLLGKHVDHGDLYLQSVRHESWHLEDGLVKEGTHGMSRGVGVRALSGEKTGFAYSDDILLSSLTDAATAAKSIARHSGSGQVKIAAKSLQHDLYPAIDPIASMEEAHKVALLQRLDKLARAIDPRVQQVNISLAANHEVILILNALGRLVPDVRPMVRLNVSVIAESQNRRELGSAGGGGRYDFAYFMENERAEGYVREAVRQALVNLEAESAPAGTMTVVLGPGWPGVLLHEAVGHGLEGDFNRKGTSAFSGRIGERVAAPGCTVVDDGTLPNRRGSLNCDDEGTPTQRTVLIEDGILRGYLQDSLNARLMNMQPTGNGRRESYAHIPMPRMTNTFMLPGPYTPEEIIASVDKGLYAVNFAGGQVDITSGKFVFTASEAYLIEGGKVTRPVKGVTLIGSGPEVLKHVSMIGNDLQLDEGIGVCGKEGQSVPVGVGQPTLKIDKLTVGGGQST
ncbi:MAG: metalloprotease TldD [Gammaproteobacteria bacterium]